MPFVILGPLGYEDPDTWIKIPQGNSAVVLAVLLVNAGRVVPVDTLVDEVWGEMPVGTARKQIQILVSGLRRRLSKLGDVIETADTGYTVRVESVDVDAWTFERRLAEARAAAGRGEPHRPASLYRQADRLWRGPHALADVRTGTLEAEALRLSDLRDTAVMERVDVELELGWHDALAVELSPLVREDPLNERLRGQLMLALHRSGRRAEAIDVYHDGLKTFEDVLGHPLGPDLRRLHQRITRHDAEPGRSGSRPRHVPRVLPSGACRLIGRGAELDAIRHALTPDASDAVQAVCVTGRPGVGKTALAVAAAHELAPAYPGGTLYADLGGDPPPASVLSCFLRSLDVPEDDVPREPHRLVESFQRATADRRVLIVLDGVPSADRVEPLLPSGPGNGMIITSRVALAELSGAVRLPLGALSPSDSHSLLAESIGTRRVEAEPEEAEALAHLCEGLPLALRTVGARLAAAGHRPLRWLRDRLADERNLLDELRFGALSVRASLQSALTPTTDTEAGVLRAVSTLGPRGFGAEEVAELAGMPLRETEDLLDHLTSLHLLDTDDGATFRCPRLLLTLLNEDRRAEGATARGGASRAGWTPSTDACCTAPT
ncbi:AfsR/SARP family transcriptional regulator [Nocardiopsis lucentensis]|uniref:AfsR/SARP family transcriptional regulator n=1 Tax=Nocardiopsis lucentensis TaxID=53441 RepID=UPI00034B0CCC|nr:BTAD domain-containing putative transcriptional regulator [Nocardiopsis lucentensis]